MTSLAGLAEEVRRTKEYLQYAEDQLRVIRQRLDRVQSELYRLSTEREEVAA